MYRTFILGTIVLAFIVILLGAYTRLGDAGLGCPDWPGCYGKLVVPSSADDVEHKHYLEARPLEPEKGWKEMVHRYFAGTLGLAILVIAIWSLLRRKLPGQPLVLPVFLLGLVIFQAVLGMWTVTWQLKPIVVMGHLLGGFTTLALLLVLYLRSGEKRITSHRPVAVSWRRFGYLAILVLAMQIALGGWTSSNYAALACPDFPVCQGSWVPKTDFKEAFVLWRGLGVNYEFGVLDHPARTAIHLTHRIGAVITALVLALFAILVLLRKPGGVATSAGVVLLLLITQWLLGIGNIVLGLPLPIAVAHNGVAALLLLSLIFLSYQLWQRRY